jgi:superfamily I DNA/RNA helicase
MSQFPDDSPVKVLTDAIYKLFGDTKPGEKPNVVTLCTLHRSKGREAPRIIWWGSTAYSPSRWARQDWQLGQEDNLCYVGATRAQEELIEVTVSGKDSK